MRNSVLLRILFGMALCVSAFTETAAQKQSPVVWSFHYKVINGNHLRLFMTATLKSGWHIYATAMSEGGPLPTKFNFKPSPDFSPIGMVHDPENATHYYDSTFMIRVISFSTVAEFFQDIVVHTLPVTVEGNVQFMVCTNELCLPSETKNFSLPIITKKSP